MSKVNMLSLLYFCCNTGLDLVINNVPWSVLLLWLLTHVDTTLTTLEITAYSQPATNFTRTIGWRRGHYEYSQEPLVGEGAIMNIHKNHWLEKGPL